MVRTRSSRTMGSRVGRTLLLAAQLSAASLPVTAAPQAPVPSTTRVRPVGATAEALLREGQHRSATFAALVDILERSDVLVYVTTGGAAGPSHLRFACSTATARFVRITINGQDAEARVIAALAHELQHAVEIARSPDVSDDAALVRYYHRHGQEISTGRFCTRTAQSAGTAVLNELCLGDRPGPR